ncbi:cell division protein ZapA [Alkalisalibacterium limincola]|uniref:Cell division protein ZapA n=1 Tax=Alkalisalibacterium limincola TaxID=2699169 RepID=A0A5C8KUR7_9GAMM|nr:cell division protein ZapA [Alkalisalibacterium limincola]TXK64981.1 cell division protein ZapA [Alkalisalibacterium limincola]
MSEPVSVRILDREYLVGCPPEERDGLLAAAKLLDARMREIRGNNRMAGIDRIAVLAALNLASELLDNRSTDGERDRELRRGLAELNRKLDGLLESESAR